jgi:hypothetical protein
LKDAIVAAVKNQVSAVVGDEAVILHLKDGTYFGLNPVGAAVWKLIEKPKTVPQLRDALVGEFEVSAAECERDLLNLLESLAKVGLIEVRDGRDGKAE